ncbi:MAG: isoprenoid biosynthesis glyoxalase ElbB [Deltaproteobacteria bacterium]|nr:isoprenoid biosynthesis glyoxalase ElbB [Deltaproteobacteria bacterium]
MKKVGVILSGCGFLDGAEIHESVLTLLALDRLGAEALCAAPNVAQMHVVNHLTGDVAAGESRNVLVESARIARGKARDVATVRADELDALILPGGYGAAKNLSDFAVKGADATVHPDVLRLVREVHAQRKPLGFVCIAPAVAAAIFRGTSVSPRLTIGSDDETASALRKMGARHVDHPTEEVEVDEANRIVSTPAYMTARGIGEAAKGIDLLVTKVLELT